LFPILLLFRCCFASIRRRRSSSIIIFLRLISCPAQCLKGNGYQHGRLPSIAFRLGIA
jgi:hypothetical protein